MRKKIIGFLIFIATGQIIAMAIWFLLDENYFVPLLIGSIAGYIVGDKMNKNKLEK